VNKRIPLALGAVVATTTDGETATAPETTPTVPQAPPPPPRLVLEVRDGRVLGGVNRSTVSRGDRVVVVVRSDVEDEVHVHGYDLLREVAPGRPARIAFRASTVGRFEIELEDRHLLLAVLEVRP
jgi:hypothetical protein